jgi:hypothetical protein
MTKLSACATGAELVTVRVTVAGLLVELASAAT